MTHAALSISLKGVREIGGVVCIMRVYRNEKCLNMMTEGGVEEEEMTKREKERMGVGEGWGIGRSWAQPVRPHGVCTWR
jgi:hypothetical protein